MFLTGLNIPVNLAVKIYNEYGDEVYDIVRTNPYKIAEDITGVGFRKADEIADRLGIGRDSDFRVRAAIMYALSGANGLGHMYIPQKMLVDKTYSLLMNEYMPYDPELEMSICNQILELSVAGKIIIKELKDDPDSGELPDVSLDDPVADIDMDLLDTESESNVTNAVYAAPNCHKKCRGSRRCGHNRRPWNRKDNDHKCTYQDIRELQDEDSSRCAYRTCSQEDNRGHRIRSTDHTQNARAYGRSGRRRDFCVYIYAE